MGIGFVIPLFAQYRLKRGLKTQIWTEAKVEQVRIMLARPVWTYLAALISIAPFVAAGFQGKFFHSLLYLCGFLWPLTTLGYVRRLLGPRDVSSNLVTFDKAGPIQSEHWGDAGGSGSGAKLTSS